MKTDNPKQIAQAWIVYQRNWWAYEKANTLCWRHPVKAWALLQQLLELADTKDLILDVGAGPLEDFIRHHAPSYIQRIESLAANNIRFRKALRNVWIPASNDDVSRRLVNLGCIPLEPSNKEKSPTRRSSTSSHKVRRPVRPVVGLK